MEVGVRSLEYGVWSTEFGVWRLEYGGSRIEDRGSRTRRGDAAILDFRLTFGAWSWRGLLAHSGSAVAGLRQAQARRSRACDVAVLRSVARGERVNSAPPWRAGFQLGYRFLGCRL